MHMRLLGEFQVFYYYFFYKKILHVKKHKKQTTDFHSDILYV